MRLPASASGGALLVPLIQPGIGWRPTHVFDQPRPPASCHFSQPAGVVCPGVSDQYSNDSIICAEAGSTSAAHSRSIDSIASDFIPPEPRMWPSPIRRFEIRPCLAVPSSIPKSSGEVSPHPSQPCIGLIEFKQNGRSVIHPAPIQYNRERTSPKQGIIGCFFRLILYFTHCAKEGCINPTLPDSGKLPFKTIPQDGNDPKIQVFLELDS